MGESKQIDVFLLLLSLIICSGRELEKALFLLHGLRYLAQPDTLCHCQYTSYFLTRSFGDRTRIHSAKRTNISELEVRIYALTRSNSIPCRRVEETVRRSRRLKTKPATSGRIVVPVFCSGGVETTAI